MSVGAHESYLNQQTADAAQRLRQILDAVAALFPQAQPCISYQMPAFRQGRVFFYVATFKNHIGIYPPVTQDAELIQALAAYRGPKGNLSFPHDQPLPLTLILQVARALHAEYAR